ALEWVTEAALASVGSGRTVRPLKGVWLIAAAAVTLVFALAGFFAARWTQPRILGPVVRLTLVPPPGEPLALTKGGVALAFAPDGRRIAYVVRRSNSTQLSIRDLASFESRLLPGTEGASFPFFS